MFSEEIKKELIRISKINKYKFKTDKNQNLVYKSKCGDQIVFQIKLINEKIRLRYNASGCIIFFASAYSLTKICDNKSKKETLDILTKVINKDFECLEEIDISLKNFENFIHTNRQDCFMLPYKALNESLKIIK
ncbi:hypothetical protein CR532_00425 [Candidatus Borreliella tachyglossi]|uniref:NIF system FeS cluster assembly NifU N-terminal domain-containing protein n=1 Tax=Candidatus Borreliella tachyglossi TaxID=1964448 RepID=A0A2S1LW13_9SPIR|nr:iron-sulfur cluster assembly scaffold protein [Candidatus Borreliella tachyglossi]AWG42482.1 hypothetical protein CR532_00425 [Candidatus Borreliella tachyglossi]